MTQVSGAYYIVDSYLVYSLKPVDYWMILHHFIVHTSYAQVFL